MSTKLYNSKILKEFGDSLNVIGASPLTVKNYVADIKQFLSWRDSGSHYFESDIELINKFKSEYSTRFSVSSLKRKSSAIKKYLSLEKSHLKSKRENNLRFGVYPLAGFFALTVLAFPLLFKDKAFELNTINTIEEASIAPNNYTIKTKDSLNFENSQGVVIALSSSMPESKPVADEMVFETAMISESSLLDKGEGKILKNNKEVLILNEFINQESFIYLTPMSPSDNQQLFVKNQGAGYMIVALQDPAVYDVTFRWKIDNTEIYHNI